MIQVNTVALMTRDADPGALTQNPDAQLTIQFHSHIWLRNTPFGTRDGYVNSHIGEFMTHFWANHWKINWRTLEPSSYKKRKGEEKNNPMWCFFLWTQTAGGRRGPLDNNDVVPGYTVKGRSVIGRANQMGRTQIPVLPFLTVWHWNDMMDFVFSILLRFKLQSRGQYPRTHGIQLVCTCLSVMLWLQHTCQR